MPKNRGKGASCAGGTPPLYCDCSG